MAVGRDPNTISIGAGTLYVAPIGTTEPALLSSPLAGGWVDLGYTEAGTVFTTTMTKQAVMVDEEEYPVFTVVTEKAGTVALALSQITAENMQIAYAGGTITTSSGDVQFEPPVAGTETRVMLLWQSRAADERYLWRQCFQSGNVATNRKKGTPQATLPVTFDVEKPSGKLPWKWYGALARTGS